MYISTTFSDVVLCRHKIFASDFFLMYACPCIFMYADVGGSHAPVVLSDDDMPSTSSKWTPSAAYRYITILNPLHFLFLPIEEVFEF